MGAIAATRALAPVDPKVIPKRLQIEISHAAPHALNATVRHHLSATGNLVGGFLTFQLENKGPKARLPHEGGC